MVDLIFKVVVLLVLCIQSSDSIVAMFSTHITQFKFEPAGYG